MKNDKTHLDDFFASARNINTSAPSDEAVRSLLERTDEMQPLTQTSFWSNKGVRIMGSMTLLGAAVVAGLLSFSGNELPIGNQQLAMSNTPVVKSEERLAATREKNAEPKTILVKHVDGAKVSTPPKPPSPPAPALPPTPQKKIMAPLEVKVQPVTKVTKDQLAGLGINTETTKGLGFLIKMGKDEYTKYYIPNEGWGVTFSDEKVAKPKHEVFPILVTDARGNKRLMHFADANSMVHMQRMDGTRQEIKMSVDAGDGMPTMHIMNQEQEIHINNTDTANGKHGQQMRIYRSAKVKGGKGEKNIEINGNIDMSDENNIKMHLINRTEDSTLDENDINEKVTKALFHAKKEINKMKINMKGMKGLDSTMKNLNIQIAGMHGRDSGMKIDMRMAEMLNGDSLGDMRDHLKNMKGAMMIEMNMSDSMPNMKDMMMNMPDIENEIDVVGAKVSEKLNHLIPVLVREATTTTHNAEENRDYDNGVIMWFEASKDLYDAVPDLTYETIIEGDLISGTLSPFKMPSNAFVPKTDSEHANGTSKNINQGNKENQLSVSDAYQVVPSVFLKTLVFPNPAISKATVRFSLNQPRSVVFSVHDITGKRLIDGGAMNDVSTGEHEYELHLNKLSAGIYLVVLTTDKGEQTIQRIVVEK